MAQRPRNRFVVWVSTLLAGILLYLALRGINWAVFFLYLQRANYLYVVLIVIWGSAVSFLRALRWRILLNSQKYIPPVNIFWANMAGYLGNTVLPARAGEFIRAAYVARMEKISLAFVLATGFTERLVDLAALVIIGAASLFFVEAFPRPVQAALKSFAIVAIVGVIFIFLLPLFHEFIRRILTALPFLGQSLKSKLNEMIVHFLAGMQVITRLERGSPFLLFTILIWLMDGIGTVVLALALHETLTLAQAFLLIAALGLSSAIPSTPGYVGVYQFVAVTVLVPFGFARESALALILISQSLNLLAVSFWGGIGLWIGSNSMSAARTKNTHGEFHD